jgi:hypothetical protein
MKVNFIFGSLSLLMAASYAAPVYGQQSVDVSTFVQLAQRGTDVANNCTAITNKIVAMPVPPDLATARAAQASNAASQRQMPISDASRNYLQQIDVLKLQLSSCGKNFAAANSQIAANAKQLHQSISQSTIPHAEAQKAATAMKAYNEAHQGLVRAISTLSNDRQVESLFSKIIVGDFIQEARK